MQSEQSLSHHRHVNSASPRSTSTTAGGTSDIEESPKHRDKGKVRALDNPDLTPSASTPHSNGSVGAQSADLDDDEGSGGETEDEAWCLICHTSPIADRTVLPRCLHSQFCFTCILRWISIKRRCPLCVTDIGDHVIHAIREDDDYVRYHLPPVPSTSATAQGDRNGLVRQVQRARAHRRRRHHLHTPESDSDSALALRTHIYRHSLYAHHVGSNRHTHYRPAPTPAQVRHDVLHGGGAHIARRITTFVRRELHVWPYVDVEFLTRYVLSLLQVFDVAQEETVRLVGEFLGEATARHLLHELECFLRSGKREVRDYDASALLQYGSTRVRRRSQAETSSIGLTVVEERSATSNSRHDADEIGESSASSIRTDVAARRANLLDRLERERALLNASRPTMPS